MKAAELRINNWYNENGTPKQVTPNTIEELFISERIWIDPIQLTEEWLLKFGFKYTKMEVGFNQFRKGILELSITPNGYELFFTYKWVNIEHVHQLQNLYFALTNEELTLIS